MFLLGASLCSVRMTASGYRPATSGDIPCSESDTRWRKDHGEKIQLHFFVALSCRKGNNHSIRFFVVDRMEQVFVAGC
jgi:hypothetical protein